MAPETGDFDFYDRPTPYEVLGVSPDASAADIRDRHNALQRDIQERDIPLAERSREKERLDAAYNQLRVAGGRMRVDFFLLDARVGLKQCATIAAELPKPNTQIEGLIRPRQIKVTHVALLDELEAFFRDPGKVVGLVPRPMDVDEPFMLPGPLAVTFDC